MARAGVISTDDTSRPDAAIGTILSIDSNDLRTSLLASSGLTPAAVEAVLVQLADIEQQAPEARVTYAERLFRGFEAASDMEIPTARRVIAEVFGEESERVLAQIDAWPADFRHRYYRRVLNLNTQRSDVSARLAISSEPQPLVELLDEPTPLFGPVTNATGQPIGRSTGLQFFGPDPATELARLTAEIRSTFESLDRKVSQRSSPLTALPNPGQAMQLLVVGNDGRRDQIEPFGFIRDVEDGTYYLQQVEGGRCPWMGLVNGYQAVAHPKLTQLQLLEAYRYLMGHVGMPLQRSYNFSDVGNLNREFGGDSQTFHSSPAQLVSEIEKARAAGKIVLVLEDGGTRVIMGPDSTGHYRWLNFYLNQYLYLTPQQLTEKLRIAIVTVLDPESSAKMLGLPNFVPEDAPVLSVPLVSRDNESYKPIEDRIKHMSKGLVGTPIADALVRWSEHDVAFQNLPPAERLEILRRDGHITSDVVRSGLQVVGLNFNPSDIEKVVQFWGSADLAHFIASARWRLALVSRSAREGALERYMASAERPMDFHPLLPAENLLASYAERRLRTLTVSAQRDDLELREGSHFERMGITSPVQRVVTLFRVGDDPNDILYSASLSEAIEMSHAVHNLNWGNEMTVWAMDVPIEEVGPLVCKQIFRDAKIPPLSRYGLRKIGHVEPNGTMTFDAYRAEDLHFYGNIPLGRSFMDTRGTTGFFSMAYAEAAEQAAEAGGVLPERFQREVTVPLNAVWELPPYQRGFTTEKAQALLNAFDNFVASANGAESSEGSGHGRGGSSAPATPASGVPPASSTPASTQGASSSSSSAVQRGRIDLTQVTAPVRQKGRTRSARVALSHSSYHMRGVSGAAFKQRARAVARG